MRSAAGFACGRRRTSAKVRFPQELAPHHHEKERGRKMTKQIAPLSERQAWKALTAHYENVSRLHLRQLFVDDPKRGERLTAEAVGLFLDYSKNRITDETLKLLLQLANESGLRERIDAMFGGEKINVTENRAVLHVALRAPRGASIVF